MIGRQVSHFYVIRSLGSGGMGVVYEAQDTRLPRSVAIKFLKSALSKDIDAVRRFKREARLASSLNHPNICTILDVDEGNGQPFIAMELLQGRTVKERLSSNAFELSEILDIGIQVSDALAAAHDQAIMHRDITPGNIFVTDAGVVKLLDFGLAKHFASSDSDEPVSEDVTEPGSVTGTVRYMAPELFIEGNKVDHRCDLFSFGAVLYTLATGARPFEAKSKHEVIRLILEQPHIPLRQLAPQYPAQLEQLVDKLLAKRPQDRYESAWALRADLQAIRRRVGRGSEPQVKERESPRRASIAVLPFERIGAAEADVSSFREGLAEDISGRLSHIRNLRVAPRTSTRLVASESIQYIGKRLDVQMVLEGSVQQVDDRVRVIANLIDAANERPILPALKVERQFDSILNVQDDIAREIVDRMAKSFSRLPDRRLSQDPEANLALKRGHHYWHARFSGGWRPAIEQFQYAVERDDQFALAHVALANAYEFLGFYCLMKPNLAFSVARKSIDRALQLDETFAAAHAVLGLIKFGGDWDWDGSEEEFRRALQLDPANSMTHVCYAWLLMLLGREDAALREAREAFSLAPTSRFVSGGLAQTFYLSCRYDEAIEVCNECLRVDPAYVFALSLRGQCYELKSMFPEAVTDLERTVTLTNRTPFYVGMLGHCYGEAGMRSQALELLTELDRQARETYVPPQCYVYIFAGLGERERALQYQEQAYEDGASPFNYLVPSIRNLYALDPQQKERLQQMRLLI